MSQKSKSISSSSHKKDPSPSPPTSDIDGDNLSATDEDDVDLKNSSAPSSDIDTDSASPPSSPSSSVPNLPVRATILPSVEELNAKTSAKQYDDPSMRLSRINVEKAKNDNSGRVYRVYCDGVFDLFHVGHARMLEQAKKALGDPKKVYLLAGVCMDEDVHKFKGKTVMDHALRVNSVSHCKWVDEVLADAPWVIDDAYLQKYNIDFVAHDAIPYTDHSGVSDDASDVYGHVKKRGMFLETQRTEGLSTSDLIVNIIKDYDDYVVRNLSRGYTKKDLNVGKSWEYRARFHEASKKIRKGVNETKSRFRSVESYALAFVKEFNPKYLVRNNQQSGRREFTPRSYIDHLRTNVPEKAQGLVHHSLGLAKAVCSITWECIKYVNPLTCCRKSKYQ